MKKVIAALFVLALLIFAPAVQSQVPTGCVLITGAGIQNAGGTPLSAGTITFTPISNFGTSCSVPGQATTAPVTVPVSHGSFSVLLADGAYTTPQWISFAVVATDSSTGNVVLQTGLESVQPASSGVPVSSGFCTTAKVCNLDLYQPNLNHVAIVQYGPTGPAPNLTGGTATSVPYGSAPAVSVTGTNPNYQVNISVPQGQAAPVGAYRGAYSAATSYAVGDVVAYSGLSYTSLGASNMGNEPDISPLRWGLLISESNLPSAFASQSAANPQPGSFSTVAARTSVTAFSPVNVQNPAYGMSPSAAAATNTAGFMAAVTAAATTTPNIVYIPAGNYSITCPLTVGVGHVAVKGDGPGTILSCANSASADSVLYLNGGAGMYNNGISDLTLNGNANISYGIHASYAHHGRMDNVRVVNVATCAYELDHVVVSELSIPTLSINDAFPSWVTAPQYGVCVNNSDQISIDNPIIEGASVVGIISNASTGTQINFGTVEAIGSAPAYGDGTCVSLGGNTNSSLINGVDLEQCSAASLTQTQGTGNVFLDLVTPASPVIVGTGASNTSIIGGRLGSLTIAVGASDTVVNNSVITGTFTNSSATTTIVSPISTGSGTIPATALPASGGVIQPTTDSATVFTVRNAAGTKTILAADTVNGALDVEGNSGSLPYAYFGSGGNNAAQAQEFYFSQVNAFNSGYNINGTSGMTINYSGYHNGATQYRDVNISDGKTVTFFHLDGTNHAMQFENPASTTAVACNSANVLMVIAVKDSVSNTPGAAYTAGGSYTTTIKCTFNSTGSVYAWIVD